MALMERSEALHLGQYLTIAEAARLKGVRYDTLRMWLRNHPEIETKRVGSSIVVRLAELEKYEPMR